VNNYCALGLSPERADQLRAVERVPNVAGAIAITAGLAHSCALLSGGAELCWGDDVHGELGDGNTATQSCDAVVVNDPLGAQSVTAGANASCVVSSGAVRCWGANYTSSGVAGQLGNGSTVATDYPFPSTVMR
jgi:alpha-tubulin suppressor-like RCC1 family protein